MKNILADIKNQTFKKVYLLCGTEEYLRAQYRDKLIKALVPDGDTMNFTEYEGKNIVESEVIGQAETMPFFADRRVILIRDSGMFKRSMDKLADYLAALPEYLVMVFEESEIDKRNRMYKAVQKNGYIAEFGEQTEETLTRWVLAQMAREGKKIRRQDMQLFLDLTGTDMANIHSELEKLLSYTMGKDEITKDDIEMICAPQLTNQIFEMVNAVASHQQRRALDYYYDLLALKEPPMRILYLLSRQFNQLVQIKSMLKNGENNRTIASKIGIPPFVVTKSAGLCRRYTEETLRKIVEDCTQAETDVKTGRLGDELSVEMLIIRYSAD